LRQAAGGWHAATGRSRCESHVPLGCLQVLRFNGTTVINLRHLAELVAGCSDEFLRFDCDYGETVLISRQVTPWAFDQPWEGVRRQTRGRMLQGRWAWPAAAWPLGGAVQAASAVGPTRPPPPVSLQEAWADTREVLGSHCIPAAMSPDLQKVLPNWPPPEVVPQPAAQ